jgi:murein DD-endopeptidase MepM/ murein hydrolase activator NlpD
MAVQRTRSSGLSSLWLPLAFMVCLGGAAWAEAQGLTPVSLTRPAVAYPPVVSAPPQRLEPPMVRELVWSGADIDKDGQPDFANPTGKPVRGCDGYGCGGFGSRRDGGGRRHAGVDFDAAARQPVDAPISGFVTKIGEAYVDDGRYRFVEITNPALRYMARVFYVDPSVEEGQAVRLGQPIGRAHSLEPRYPGITNHVHLELSRLRGRKIDAARMIFTREMVVPAASAMAEAAQPPPPRG